MWIATRKKCKLQNGQRFSPINKMIKFIEDSTRYIKRLFSLFIQIRIFFGPKHFLAKM